MMRPPSGSSKRKRGIRRRDDLVRERDGLLDLKKMEGGGGVSPRDGKLLGSNVHGRGLSQGQHLIVFIWRIISTFLF